MKYAGKDATAAYNPVHPDDALEKNLPKEKHLGSIDADAVRKIQEAGVDRKKTRDERRMEQAKLGKPPLKRILTLQDMEVRSEDSLLVPKLMAERDKDVARDVLSYQASAYYSSAADDQISERLFEFLRLRLVDQGVAHTENVRGFSRFFFHPRVLRTVSRCDPSTIILGYKSSIPVFASAVGLAKLGHPLGETNITRGAGRTGIIQMVSTNSSFSASEIAAARVSPTQPLFFQLYKNRQDSEAEKLVKEVEALGYNAIVLTVDAIIAGRRDRDIKAPFVLEDQEKEATKQQPSVEEPHEEEEDTLGTSGALVAESDVDMTWERVSLWHSGSLPGRWTIPQTIPWLRKVTKLPIVIKGTVNPTVSSTICPDYRLEAYNVSQ